MFKNCIFFFLSFLFYSCILIALNRYSWMLRICIAQTLRLHFDFTSMLRVCIDKKFVKLFLYVHFCLDTKTNQKSQEDFKELFLRKPLLNLPVRNLAPSLKQSTRLFFYARSHAIFAFSKRTSAWFTTSSEKSSGCFHCLIHFLF